ncbi:MAG: sugar phosphate isomerase/epimerase [Clostridia bacterium]|nr:sugar phosphate isomerase/epimerase [Clostridia bacterium]
MKLSLEVHVMRERYGDAKAIEMLHKAGFDAVDYSFYYLKKSPNRDAIIGNGYLEHAHQVRRLLDEKGMVCNQAHAPFDMTRDDAMDESNENFLEIVHAMEAAAIMGAPMIVVHAPTADIDYDIEYYRSLEPYCKRFGIKVAVENLFLRPNFTSRLGTPDELNQVLAALDPAHFCACLDVGHAQLTYRDPAGFIAGVLPGRIECFHIQDNDLESDSHLLPYLAKMDWDSIISSIAAIGFNRDITLELVAFLQKFPTEETMQAALNLCASVGRNIISRIEAAR